MRLLLLISHLNIDYLTMCSINVTYKGNIGAVFHRFW